MKNYLPFALPDIGEEEINEVIECLRSGWLTTGPKVKRFEEELADYLGGGVYAVAVNSATSGLHLALEALGIGAGDEVITTPYTFTATAEVIRYLGADPVFVDIDPQTFNIDTAKIPAALTDRTKAMIPVHLAGLACNMDEILNIARSYGLKVVEDAAHALPCTYKGQLIGTLESDATVYSFYVTKPLATGEGGMLVTRKREIADHCRIMRLHGISRDVYDRYTSTKPAWHYEVVAPGFKYNMTDIAAAIGINQLKKGDAFQAKRSEMAKRYDDELSGLPIMLPPRPLKGDIHSWHLYIIRLSNSAKISRNVFIEKMSDRGIGCSVHYIPLHLHPYWRVTYDLKPQDFPHALAAYEQAVSLPLYTKMTETDQERVIEAVKEVLR